MPKLNKKTGKAIRELADSLPQQRYTVPDSTLVSGADLILANTTEIDGVPVDPEKLYDYHLPRYHEVNHKRRLKRAFNSRGKAGVIDYCNPYLLPESKEDFLRIVNNRL